jgi:hypothetical protein
VSISPYTYIRRAYDVHPIVGEWVRHNETGRYGMVQPPEVEGGTHYVRVRFDGDSFDMNCHPKALDYSFQPHPDANASRKCAIGEEPSSEGVKTKSEGP